LDEQGTVFRFKLGHGIFSSLPKHPDGLSVLLSFLLGAQRDKAAGVEADH